MGKLAVRLLYRRLHGAGCMPVRPETGETARLGLVGIDRKCLVVTSSGMGNMIRAPTEGMTYPCIDNIKD